ncbi:MAG: hypothetical protein GY809_32785 [Planctomycetes bacterium]|nr:hypothetical protein [Planctomycetota bacterium]
MKPRILISLAILVALAALFGSCAKIEPPKPGPDQQIVFKTKLSDDMLARAAKLSVYTLQPAGVDRGTFDMRAQQLFGRELSGTAILANGVITMAGTSKASNFMMLDLGTGYLSFNRGMADQIDDKPGNLPSDDKAVDLAREFLNKNKLGPGHLKEMTLAHVGHIRSASFDPKTEIQGPVRDQMLTIYFGRKLNDVPVVGSGSTMIVRIGDEGKVVGGARRWTEHDAGRSLKVKDLRSVEQLTKDIQTFLRKELSTAKRIEVVQFILAYYDNGGKHIQPVLAYEANVTGDDLKYAYLGQTALLRSPPERVGPEPLSKEAQRSVKKSSPNAQPSTEGGD